MTLFVWKWSWWRIKNICCENFHKRYLYHELQPILCRGSARVMSLLRVNSLMEMHYVPILHKRCRSKTIFYVFIYDKTSLKFCASFRIFLAVFVEKIQKIRYLSYVRRGIKGESGAKLKLCINIICQKKWW